MLRHNGLYYMMYSANYFGGANYAVGYAVSEHPLGPFEKASNNPVLEKNVEKGGIVTGTGHNMALLGRRTENKCIAFTTGVPRRQG